MKVFLFRAFVVLGLLIAHGILTPRAKRPQV
jgi:hypothetical protein